MENELEARLMKKIKELQGQVTTLGNQIGWLRAMLSHPKVPSLLKQKDVIDHGKLAGLQHPDHTETALLLSDNTTNNATAARHGFLAKLSGAATDYMDGTGAWSEPPDELESGSIIGWEGYLVDCPTGWSVCDGTGGTPDLTDEFVDNEGIVGYVRLDGRSGGQLIVGGTEAGDDLTLHTTSDATKGSYILTDLTGGSGFVKADNMRVLTAGHNEVNYLAASVTVNTGTLAGGSDHEDTWSPFDGSICEVAEVTGTPGFDIEFGFTGVTDFDTIRCRVCYNGAATHWVTLDIYDYDTLAWLPVGLVLHTDAYYQWYNFKIPTSVNYIDSGAAKFRLYHQTAGNAAHDIYIDYVSLVNTLR